MFKRAKKTDAPEFLRRTVPELKGEYRDAIAPSLRDPYMVAALTVEALNAFSEDHERCYRQLAILKGPLKFLPRDRELIRVALEEKSYIPRAYFEGATPENGYTPALPHTIVCDVSPLAMLDVEILKISVRCSGDAMARVVSLRRRGDLFYLWDYGGLLLDVTCPAVDGLADAETPDETSSEISEFEGVNGMTQFPIGCWTYAPMSKVYPNMVKDWHDLGLTNPLTPHFAIGDDKTAMLRLLDECASYGMEVFVFDDRTFWPVLTEHGEAFYRKSVAEAVADFGGHPAVKGFYIGDEPDAPDAANAFAAARICRESAPNLCPYLNLLPWFDWIGERIGSDAYAPYLDRAAVEGNLKLLAYDCYTQMWDGDTGWDVYFNNLREHSLAAARNGIDFCSTLLSMGHYDYRCPNLDDFRWQVSTAAAFGAKSIAWFYVHQHAIGANYRQPPINIWNERTQTFEWLSTVNRQFQQQFGSELMRLTVRDFGFIGKAYGGAELFKPCDKILDVENGKGLPLLFNRFTDKTGKTYAVIVNLDNVKSVTANVHLAQGVKLFMRSFEGAYEPVSAINDAVGKQVYGAGAQVASVVLAPGQMELLRYED